MKKSLTDIYQEQFQKFGDTPAGVFWNDKTTQHLRFDRIYKGLLPYFQECPTICDVGCGTGEFHDFLGDKKINFAYTGIDIVPAMIKVANTKFPNGTFLCDDFLTTNIREKFDFIILSGSLNMIDTNQNWKSTCYEIIRKMYLNANKGISFNFLTNYSDFYNKDLIYFKPEEVFEFCLKNLSRFTNLDHSYPLFEATVSVICEDAVKSIYPQSELQKYFKTKK